ncbi:MAG: hypothetical protein WBB70_14080 [Desulfobacterales bacterium]
MMNKNPGAKDQVFNLKKVSLNKIMSVDGDKQIGKTYERKIYAGK